MPTAHSCSADSGGHTNAEQCSVNQCTGFRPMPVVVAMIEAEMLARWRNLRPVGLNL